jgi:glycosyltransferase involved in cell wall biosynthesis
MCQITALTEQGFDIALVAPRSFRDKLRSGNFPRYTELIDRRPSKLPKPLRAAVFMKEMVEVHHVLARHLDKNPSRYVLMGDFGEYMAPVWQPMLLDRKKRSGSRFGCVLHDPVRNLVRGPRWWHDLSLDKAFGLFDDAFIHGAVPPELADRYPSVEFVEVPHGVFSGSVVVSSADDARRQLNLPAGVPVFLQFGHVRDNKNIDVIIQALGVAQEAHLVIAGEVTSGSQRSEEFYRALVDRLGLRSRVHFRLGFVEDDDIPLLFSAADAVCLLYANTFRSMSGVLAHAITYRTPVIASGGEGPLRTIVRRYNLGMWLDAPNAGSVANAIKAAASGNLSSPDWARCARECSWQRNAELVASRIRS